MPVRTSGINVRRFSVNIRSEAFFRISNELGFKERDCVIILGLHCGTDG